MEKDESEFSKKKDGKGGLRSICKQCQKTINAEYRETHKNQLSEYGRKWRAANKDYCKQFDKQRNTQRKAYIHKWNQEYWITHKKEITENTRKYRKEHPETRRKELAARRGIGFNQVNNLFNGSTAHHLYLEGNNSFVIYLPSWEHELYKHNPKKPESMTTINSIALDFWINESLYNELFKP